MSETNITEEYVKEGEVYKRTYTQILFDISLTELENMKADLELQKIKQHDQLSGITQTIAMIDETISKIDAIITTSG